MIIRGLRDEGKDLYVVMAIYRDESKNETFYCCYSNTLPNSIRTINEKEANVELDEIFNDWRFAKKENFLVQSFEKWLSDLNFPNYIIWDNFYGEK